ncbi:unnamed protein product [Acanthoscelides obtectus]|uniref:Uncharacterized protein n=1 Tax=Acanthoscelides obtectus TaxID=200917 RepID=A0A9P0PFB0_ACAOB|nr:unnamed protein product [Acanthoscelides obtectus]CAK1687912.1 Transposable element Tc3 transposase [Acanthoscelides obtectus]
MWCRQRSLWDREWNSIVFSDESRFCLGMHDGRARVRRRRGERRNPQFFVERHVHHIVGVMVWGAIAYGSRSPLIFIRDNMNAQRYIHEVLEPHLLPYLDTLADPTFQQDNVRPHVARVTIDFFQHNDVTLLPWPPRSPDLSPIEHVWDMMGRRLLNLQRPPQTLEALREQLVVAWNEIPQEDIDHLIRSMPRRVGGKMELNREHFRAIIYYNFQKQLSQLECLAELLSVFGNEATHQSTVSHWYGEFKRGRVRMTDDTGLSDDPRVGAPKTAVTQENDDAVRKLIIENRHVTYREIEASLKISKTKVIPGHIATIPLNEQKTVTADRYTTICLPKVITELRKNNPERRIILHQYNASSHTAQKTRQYLTEENVELLDHPPYSPDISPNDFFTFLKIKTRLRGQRFQSPEEAVDAFKNAVDLLGDFNAHNELWLGSNKTVAAGRAVEAFALTQGLTQLVTSPTFFPRASSHASSLLDLFLTTHPVSYSTAMLSPLSNSDHGVVEVRFRDICFSDADASAVCSSITEIIHVIMEEYIPHTVKVPKPESNGCRRSKHRTFLQNPTVENRQAVYDIKVKHRIISQRNGSRSFWTLANQIEKNFSHSGLRPLTCQDGTIVFDTKAKAEVLSIQRVPYTMRETLDINKASGPDMIPASVLKRCAAELAPVLSHLFQISYESSTFPENWKFAHVQPMLKKGSKTDPYNYRPIALLSVISKRSISWWHAALLTKLPSYGLPENLCRWVADFISSCKISVVIDGFSSSSRNVNAGVPQGSVLAPTLILLHINDLLSCTINPIHSFADPCR